jgi:hypothetical protein
VQGSSPTLHTGVRVFGSAIAVLLALILVLGRFGPGPPPDAPKAPPYTQLGLTMLTLALAIQLLGLVIALRWEVVGGILAIVGYLLKQATLSVDGGVPFLVFPLDIWLWPALAGLLYLACWWLNHRQRPGRGIGRAP